MSRIITKQGLQYVNGNYMKINKANKFDEYFTKPEIAKQLFETTKNIISNNDDIEKYTWVEPSVGDCCFFDLLPKNKRIGIDINAKRSEILKSDYLKFNLPNKPIIVIGNPPFGHRGVLALEFIKHSKHADFVAFILPMFFRSLGKGSIRYRVKEFNLLYEQDLPENAFYTFDGKNRDINCCFQIWSKNYTSNKFEFSWYNNDNKKLKPFDNIIDVYTVSLAKNRECGKKWIYEQNADFYISSTFFKENKTHKSFDKVNYKSGIAIVMKTNDQNLRAKLNEVFENADWIKYSTLATNGCRQTYRQISYI